MTIKEVLCNICQHRCKEKGFIPPAYRCENLDNAVKHIKEHIITIVPHKKDISMSALAFNSTEVFSSRVYYNRCVDDITKNINELFTK